VLAPRSALRKAPCALVLAAIGIAACGGSRAETSSTVSLGRAVATTASRIPSSAPTATAVGTAEPPEAIYPPPPPSPRAPQSRTILRVARRFAGAYLRYQIGKHPSAVAQTLIATCTSSFAHLLIAQPARILAGQRRNPAYRPAALTRVTYTGQASLRPGPPEQIVIATYHTIGNPSVRGQLTIHLIGNGGSWRVAYLG
jgi:hypothetical protein